jgi:capsular polysaccharide biosynthesis protein
MSQQAMDLRRPLHIVRRHKVLVGSVAAFGLLAGAAYAWLHPPLVKSTALVVLPQAVLSAGTLNATGADGGAPTGSDTYMSTQIFIVDSNPVLSGALRYIGSAKSLPSLRTEIQVASPTYGILSISAMGRTAAQAETTANAVAHSYIAYVGPNSPAGHVPASVLAPAASATGTAPIKHLITYALIGAVIGILTGVIVALAISYRDRRLFERDDIANSIGIPVLASISVRHPSDAAEWTKLVQAYKPGAVDAWQLRMAMQQLGMTGHAPADRLHNSGSGGLRDDGLGGGCFSLAVLCLSSDAGALALGPQLAVFASSLGIPTALVIGPQQDANPTATLRAACAALAPASPIRSGLLQVIVSDDGKVDLDPDIALVVVVAVADGQSVKKADLMRTTATVIGVSAATATAEQLARAAGVAAADGREIAGILVADPESTDRTTGRIPRPVRPTWHGHGRPSSLRGMATEIRR